MEIIKAFHIIAMVAWFSGLFYLPRLFVYHADTTDKIGRDRFTLMEKRLYYAITWPAAIVTTLLGLFLLTANANYYLHTTWMPIKLAMVFLVWCFHLSCGHYHKQWLRKPTRKSLFFRIFNEIPTVLLMIIVILAVVKPGYLLI